MHKVLKHADRKYEERKSYEEILQPLIELIHAQLGIQLASVAAD